MGRTTAFPSQFSGKKEKRKKEREKKKRRKEAGDSGGESGEPQGRRPKIWKGKTTWQFSPSTRKQGRQGLHVQQLVGGQQTTPSG